MMCHILIVFRNNRVVPSLKSSSKAFGNLPAFLLYLSDARRSHSSSRGLCRDCTQSDSQQLNGLKLCYFGGHQRTSSAICIFWGGSALGSGKHLDRSPLPGHGRVLCVQERIPTSEPSPWTARQIHILYSLLS